MIIAEILADRRRSAPWFHVTGVYHQEIHAQIGDALTKEEAILKAMALFDEWMLTMPAGGLPGVSFGPEEPCLNEDVTITEARDPTPEDPRYWTEREEIEVWRKDGGWEVQNADI